MSKPFGFVVVESSEAVEQTLALMTGPDLPPGGILTWRCEVIPSRSIVFRDRKSAKAAIDRTEHYRLAFGSNNPERRWCDIVPVELAEETP